MRLPSSRVRHISNAFVFSFFFFFPLSFFFLLFVLRFNDVCFPEGPHRVVVKWTSLVGLAFENPSIVGVEGVSVTLNGNGAVDVLFSAPFVAILNMDLVCSSPFTLRGDLSFWVESVDALVVQRDTNSNSVVSIVPLRIVELQRLWHLDSPSRAPVGDLDLGMNKGAPQGVTPGESTQFVYRLRIANAGPGDAADVLVVDELPLLFTYGTPLLRLSCPSGCGGASVGSCAINASFVLECVVPSLTGGASWLIDIPFTVPSGTPLGPVENTACVLAEDNQPDNNCNTATILVQEAVDVSLQTLTSTIILVAGAGPVELIFVGGNNGPSTAENVEVTFMIPAPLVLGSINATVPCTPFVGGFTCFYGEIIAFFLFPSSSY